MSRTKTLEEHVEHIWKIFEVFKFNELYVNKEKCSFPMEEMSVLEHCIKDDKLMIDESKIKAIQE